ncbi:centriole and centriolar satellite protein ofd1-like [Carassius gibelio]|uniref:centriole and centriolar satellite protein ofd1-like n=1 Tax=Carassius gibelio TaxID=101364 RepID=UPI002279078C|nr:centriole and centriolar satellite protein ofd1-like [Carassius gibelio]
MRESESEREEEQEREEREHHTINIQEDQHEEQAGDHREGTEGHVTVTSAVIGGGAEEAGPGADDVANPLHKYMMMLMQDKRKQQSSAQEASEKHSLEEFESENEEHSVELISHQEPDDDFW